MTRDDILGGSVRPSTKPVEAENIPLAMREAPRWLAWNWQNKKGRWAKVPVGKSNDPTTWSSFGEIFATYCAGNCDGVGFALGDGWSGIDLDACRNADGEFTTTARDVVAAADSYSEISPTGTGVKIYLRGELPKGSNTKGADVEVYSFGRYFCVTGDKLSGNVADRQRELESIYRRYVAKQPQTSSTLPRRTDGSAAVEAMRRIGPKEGENDGSNRLFAWACRAVEHDLTDDEAIAAIREAERTHPFPAIFRDDDILKRIRHAEGKAVRGSAKPAIFITSDFPRLVAETVESLAGNCDVFQNLGRLVRIDRQPEPCPFAKFDNGSPRLAFIPPGAMLETLTASADFYCYDGRSKKSSPKLPTGDLRSAIFYRGHYPGVRQLYGVVSRPILFPTGELVTTLGYCGDVGLYIDVAGDWPSIMSTDEAIEKIRDVWSDFPFASEASWAGSLAALLTLLCRRMIGGNTPLFVVDGNRSRVGKGLLSDTWTMIAEGRRASRYSQSSAEELRKFLTSVAIRGSDYILFDNLQGKFGNATLEAAMTTGAISDRIMAKNEVVDVPLPICWFATGNGYTCSRDMVGRTLPIMLDTDVANPENHDGFRYPNLLGHVAEHRRELLVAGLSIVGNYLRAGSPKQAISNFGGFEEWSNLIRGAVVYAGMPDPLKEREHLVEASHDGEKEVVARLMNAWTFKKATRVCEAMEEIEKGDGFAELRAILAERDENVSASRYLGNLLRGANGVVVKNQRFVRSTHDKPKWKIESYATAS